jgi:hypothetical protein
MSITKLASGGYAVSYPGDPFPVWVSDEDRGAAFAEDRARSLIAPAGASEHPSLSSPRERRPGSNVSTFTASSAGTPRRVGGVVGVRGSWSPTTPDQPGRSAA